MEQPTPVELLQEKLKELESARNHSVKALNEGKIDEILYNFHMANLTPKIEDYKYTIQIINKYK